MSCSGAQAWNQCPTVVDSLSAGYLALREGQPENPVHSRKLCVPPKTQPPPLSS